VTARVAATGFRAFAVIVNDTFTGRADLHFVHEFAVKWTGRWTAL